MKTTPQTDATGTKNDSNGTSTEQPSVIVSPELLADGATQDGGTPKAEKTEEMPQPPLEATAGPVGDATAQTASTTAPTANADTGADAGRDEEDKLPTNDGKGLKYGLMAAAILGVIALFGIAFVVARNSVGPATSVTAPATAPAPAAPLPLPEVRTPAPRLIDATGCRPGQYRVEGNQLVFTNCATLQLAEPPAR
ncbi:MAG TPA: hypothetical protein VLC10_00555 [Patescibacteria group bacterium]|nr:hypothetical protein [Patescibacteria group bacterium]